MQERIEFETPENVQVAYKLAGLGTRFIAWITDQLLMILMMIVLFIILVASGSTYDAFLGNRGHSSSTAAAILIGAIVLIWGLGSMLYFGLCELLMHGATPGKRSLKIRVVKTNGFALDARSVFLRTVFRVLDNIPLLYIVPLLSKQSQRLGDMVAGTVVVSDETRVLGPLRETLSSVPKENLTFRFSASSLRLLRPVDVEATERLLERYRAGEMNQEEFARRAITLAKILATRMQTDPPMDEQAVVFVTDCFSCHLQREMSAL